jgi:hypothetical protein
VINCLKREDISFLRTSGTQREIRSADRIGPEPIPPWLTNRIPNIDYITLISRTKYPLANMSWS